MDKAEAYKIHQAWIEACQISDNLTEWEEKFIADIKRQLESKGFISPRQIEILEKIYSDKTD